jgi:SPP1 gp7 family putative phage head morphogenesis protein
MRPEYSQSVNARLALRAIRQAVLMEQYKTAEVRRIVAFLNQYVEPDLIAKLQKYAGKELTEKRIQVLLDAVRDITQDGYKDMLSGLRGDLLEQAKVEAAGTAKLVMDEMPFSVSLTTPTLAALRSSIDGTPIYGGFLPDWFTELSRASAHRVNQQILIGYTEGEGIDQIVRRIVGTRANRYRDGILSQSRSDVDAVVRTVVAGISKNVRDETYSANSDIVKAVQWTATLDPRTCPVCMDRDGRTYPPGETPDIPHLRCRCSIVPVVKSWKELGLPLQEAPSGTRASSAVTQAEERRLRKLDADERRAIKGQLQGQVPESLTYPEWLRRQSAEVQNEALGVRKAQMFRSGDLDIGQFVTDSGRILTLKELEAKL